MVSPDNYMVLYMCSRGKIHSRAEVIFQLVCWYQRRFLTSHVLVSFLFSSFAAACTCNTAHTVLKRANNSLRDMFSSKKWCRKKVFTPPHHSTMPRAISEFQMGVLCCVPAGKANRGQEIWTQLGFFFSLLYLALSFTL